MRGIPNASEATDLTGRKCDHLVPAGSYPLRSINKRLGEIIEACYSGNGVINGLASVYLPYASKPEDCRSNEQVSVAHADASANASGSVSG